MSFTYMILYNLSALFKHINTRAYLFLQLLTRALRQREVLAFSLVQPTRRELPCAERWFDTHHLKKLSFVS